MATRKENMNKINQERVQQISKKIYDILNGPNIFIYKKPNGKYNIQKIAQDLKISRNSVYKYLDNFNS